MSAPGETGHGDCIHRYEGREGKFGYRSLRWRSTWYVRELLLETALCFEALRGCKTVTPSRPSTPKIYAKRTCWYVPLLVLNSRSPSVTSSFFLLTLDVGGLR
jgi:hypothetical protein